VTRPPRRAGTNRAASAATGGTVYLLDDDPGMVKALERLLKTEGYDVRSYTSALAFIGSHRQQAPACLVLDVEMPELSGLEVQQRLILGENPPPMIFLTGRGDIPMSVEAMKAGASDFLVKPVKDVELLRAVRGALQRSAERLADESERDALRQRYASLTPREREVMALVVVGNLNKQIAGALGVVERTVKVHRGRVMEKMGTETLADLVRAAMRLGPMER
jgi:FixJ family two-component response regulator